MVVALRGACRGSESYLSATTAQHRHRGPGQPHAVPAHHLTMNHDDLTVGTSMLIAGLDDQAIIGAPPVDGDILPGQGSEIRENDPVERAGEHSRSAEAHPAVHRRHADPQFEIPDRASRSTGSARHRQRAVQVPVQRRQPRSQRSAAHPATSAEQVPASCPASSSTVPSRVTASGPVPPGLRSYSAPLVTMVIAMADELVQRPRVARLQARLAREHRRALAVNVGATECQMSAASSDRGTRVRLGAVGSGSL